MSIPDYQEVMLPLLRLTADGGIHNVRALTPLLAQHFQLTEEELLQMLPSGKQATFHNRAGWAKSYLLHAGLLERVRRGQFRITSRGREVLATSIEHIDNNYLTQFPEFNEFRGRSTSEDPTHAEAELITNRRTPEEALQSAYKQLRDELASELLAQIKGLSPQFFERLVLDLMLAMGYGGTERMASLTGGGSDEGIDGVINEDRLGLDIVYLQAKRWDKQVSRPEIQKFVGALHGQRARKGVFLTTSTFSSEAQNYVATIDPKVVLIDGARLAQLMIDFNVGVSVTETFSVKRVDSDYFIEE